MTKIICKKCHKKDLLYGLGLCRSCWHKLRYKQNKCHIKEYNYKCLKKWQEENRKEYNAYMNKYLIVKYHRLHPEARYYGSYKK